MPMFKVSLERTSEESRSRNPFLPTRININATTKMNVRVWKFEAEDEDQVRKFLSEARKADLPHVRGYRLRSIERI